MMRTIESSERVNDAEDERVKDGWACECTLRKDGHGEVGVGLLGLILLQMQLIPGNDGDDGDDGDEGDDGVKNDDGGDKNEVWS